MKTSHESQQRLNMSGASKERYPNPTENKAIANVMREQNAASFTIPGRLAGMNEYQSACRSHWSKGRKMKREQQERVEWSIAASRLRRFTCPVTIHIRWVEPNNKRDFDNITAASKWVLDALVSKQIIINDSEKWVKGIAHTRGLDRKNPRVEVEIREV